MFSLSQLIMQAILGFLLSGWKFDWRLEVVYFGWWFLACEVCCTHNESNYWWWFEIFAQLNQAYKKCSEAYEIITSLFTKKLKIVQDMKFEFKSIVCLDVSTKWNSTYLMLDFVIKFRKAFDRLTFIHDGYTSYFLNSSEQNHGVL